LLATFQDFFWWLLVAAPSMFPSNRLRRLHLVIAANTKEFESLYLLVRPT
jgi:hypothetical protein